MSRRRPFRRRSLFRRRPTLGRPPLPPRVRRALSHADRLLAEGRFAEAAGAFVELSDEAKRRGMLIRAAGLALQAFRAHLFADDAEAALERAREALRLFVRGGRAGRVGRVLSGMTAALRQRGYDAQADRLEQEAAQALEGVGISLDEARQRVPQVIEGRGTLPAQCGGCGARLVPDEVEWHDTRTAECLYCGAVIRAT